jgi:hypothetical protein
MGVCVDLGAGTNWKRIIGAGVLRRQVAAEVCHWRDMTFGPHLLNLLVKREVQVNSEGAQFFVRDDGRRMAKDVDAALHKQERGTGEPLRGKRQDGQCYK